MEDKFMWEVEKMKCPYCDARIEDDSKFCPDCKKKIPRCPSCGKALRLGQRFCNNDGTPIPESVYQEDFLLEDEKETGSKKGEKKTNIILMAIIIIFGVVLCLGGYFFYKNKSQTGQDTIEDKTTQSTKDITTYENKEVSETVYNDYLTSLKENQTYGTAQYAILDIDQDNIPELLVYSDWNDTVFAYTYRDEEVVQISDCPDAGFGHVLELHYSLKYKALVPYDRTSGTHEERFFQLNGTSFSHLFSVGWEDEKAATYTRYYTYRDDTSSKSLGSYIYAGEGYDEATAEKSKQEVLAKYNEYAGDLEVIPFYALADFSVGGSSHTEKIREIKAICDDIEENLDKMTKYDEEDGMTSYVDDAKRIRKIIAPAGSYNNLNDSTVNQYKAEYWYEDNNLIFVFVSSDEDQYYRFYMDGYKCFRYIDSEGRVHDYENGEDGSEISEVGRFCSLGMMELHWRGIT